MTRRLFPLCLCLTLTLALAATLASSAAAAVRMAARGPLVEMVICDHDGGLSRILIDRAGRPVDAEPDGCPASCTACTGTLAAVLPGPTPAAWAKGGPAPDAAAPPPSPAPRPEAVILARGPPLEKA
ncbi:hypothetical protein ORIO_17455 [Cereibacter azotoformans]|uniref:DUF2946 domain-containing protein n=2 Tax=Cereibacter TaxID=1653176 RepID=A0A2T5K9X8_9RHOB|nr:hypothetical protein [Cereibacter azotoformans]AXQ95341.1 hypothetical protein D0Z66_16025 [Cereibacter sphaeroides]PTR19225.1 hypothetical protein C8J28_10566 [Cereibacter azotoformans]UIJ32432.1 hypothetical protein LV780_19215 [Cereibacter azotoformans]ULB11655.1 hypothetical protein ORIO_17455 [Cereibacter azotoformans]